MKKVVYIFMAAFLAACSANLVAPSQTDVDRVQTKYPNYTLAELNEGKSLYEQNCGNCHGLRKPTSHSEAQWQKIVPSMAKKVNRKSTVLSASDQDKILKYVITMSTAPKSK